MTPQENFRFGFLLRCAEEGCTTEEIQERVKLAHDRLQVAAREKQAFAGPGFAGVARDVLSPVWNLGKTLVTAPLHATALGIAGSAALGGAGGYALAKLQNADVDPEEAKRQELMAAYKLQAELARRLAAQRSYRRPVPASPHF
jgi:hypothetical protein